MWRKDCRCNGRYGTSYNNSVGIWVLWGVKYRIHLNKWLFTEYLCIYIPDWIHCWTREWFSSHSGCGCLWRTGLFLRRLPACRASDQLHRRPQSKRWSFFRQTLVSNKETFCQLASCGMVFTMCAIIKTKTLTKWHYTRLELIIDDDWLFSLCRV